jgi:hypothetical protein
MSAARAACLAAFLCALPAAAWPVDIYVDVEKGSEKFQHLANVDWFEVEDPGIAEVEWLESSNELLISGKTVGRTLVLLYSQGKAAVWRVRVGEKGAPAKASTPPAPLAAAKAACPGLTVGGEVALSVNIKTDECRKALLALLETDAFRAGELALVFDVTMLQAQLQSIRAGLEQAGSKAEARYFGAGLLLEGTMTTPERKRALWAVFRHVVGRMALDDRSQDPAAEPP